MRGFLQGMLDRGIQVLIPHDTSRRRTTQRNWHGGRYDQMRQVLASARDRELYRKRQPMIEPVFAQMKFNRGLDPSDDEDARRPRVTATDHRHPQPPRLHRHALAAA